MLFQLRYRKGNVITAGLLELPAGTTKDQAYRYGEEFCAQEPNWRFIGVDYAILNHPPEPVVKSDVKAATSKVA